MLSALLLHSTRAVKRSDGPYLRAAVPPVYNQSNLSCEFIGFCVLKHAFMTEATRCGPGRCGHLCSIINVSSTERLWPPTLLNVLTRHERFATMKLLSYAGV